MKNRTDTFVFMKNRTDTFVIIMNRTDTFVILWIIELIPLLYYE